MNLAGWLQRRASETDASRELDRLLAEQGLPLQDAVEKRQMIKAGKVMERRREVVTDALKRRSIQC